MPDMFAAGEVLCADVSKVECLMIGGWFLGLQGDEEGDGFMLLFV